MALNKHQWMSIGLLSGLALLCKRDKPEPEECKNVKALVAYTCAECGEERGLFEVKDGNFYQFNPDLRDCGCDGFEVNTNEFITCQDCDDTFWHRNAGWSEHLRIIMNRNEDESFEAESISPDDQYGECDDPSCDEKILIEESFGYGGLDYCEDCYDSMLLDERQGLSLDETDCVSCGYSIHPADVRQGLDEDGLCENCAGTPPAEWDSNAESFEAQSRDDLIDTLIEIRQELAKEEGLEDWKNESAGPLDSLSSAFIQELIWYMDGDRDTWDAESFEAEDSRRQLKKMMEGKSKAEKKRISKMVQLRGIENTLAELLANAEVFAAPASFGEPEDNDTYHNLDETEWRNRDSCEICARPFRLNKFGMNLIQHYLKESNHGIKGWKTKENPEGTRRTARNITGFFLHEYRLDALNQYILFQEKTKISDKVIELLRLSIVERIIAGDVVNLIEMMDMQDEIDDTPIFGEDFEKDFEAESFNKL